MKIILTKDVSGLGRAGDVKEVSDGYARNFLIMRHLALPATSKALDQIQKLELERQAKVKKEQERFEQIKNMIQSKTFTIKAKADKIHLFAAVRPMEIAAAINSKLNLQIGADQIIIEKPIKTLGLNEVAIRFAQNPPIKVNLMIEGIS